MDIDLFGTNDLFKKHGAEHFDPQRIAMVEFPDFFRAYSLLESLHASQNAIFSDFSPWHKKERSNIVNTAKPEIAEMVASHQLGYPGRSSKCVR